MNNCCETNKRIIQYEGTIKDKLVQWGFGHTVPVGMSHKFTALLECQACGYSWTEPRVCKGTVTMRPVEGL